MTAFEGDSVLIGCDLCQTEVTFPAHGQFTAKDDRPPNNPARESVAFLWGSRTAVKRDAENDCSHVRTGGCRLGSADGGVRETRGDRIGDRAGAYQHNGPCDGRRRWRC